MVYFVDAARDYFDKLYHGIKRFEFCYGETAEANLGDFLCFREVASFVPLEYTGREVMSKVIDRFDRIDDYHIGDGVVLGLYTLDLSDEGRISRELKSGEYDRIDDDNGDQPEKPSCMGEHRWRM
jgi:hypothetical protein